MPGRFKDYIANRKVWLSVHPYDCIYGPKGPSLSSRSDKEIHEDLLSTGLRLTGPIKGIKGQD